MVGALVEKEGQRTRVNARVGVVLACGGFPHDIERRKALFPHAPTGSEHYTPSPEANTGDGLRMAEAVGGRVDPTIPHAAAWVPTSVTTRPDGTRGVMPHFIDRAKPGVIAVTRHGKRFTNEGNSYHDFVQDLVKATKGDKEVFAWELCDHKTLRQYGMGCVAPFPLPIGRHLRTGYLQRGRTVAELARKIGVDPNALQATIDVFNKSARNGEDPAFGKGSKAYNRYQGDALNLPNPCVRPLETGPFYAIKLVIGDIGTFAGLVTDAKTRVLDANRQPIKGLYAVGNDAASVMGGNYPGAGITLGPALTFGYVAGMTLSQAAQPRVQRRRAFPTSLRRLIMTSTNFIIPRVLDGRLAFVTGAGQGNGREIALGLAQAGARVIVTDMNEPSVAATADAIRCSRRHRLVVHARRHAVGCLPQLGCARRRRDRPRRSVDQQRRHHHSRGQRQPECREELAAHPGREREWHVQRHPGVAARASRHARHDPQHRLDRGLCRAGRQPRLLAVQGRDQDVHAITGRRAREGRRAGQRARAGRHRNADDGRHAREPGAAARSSCPASRWAAWDNPRT